MPRGRKKHPDLLVICYVQREHCPHCGSLDFRVTARRRDQGDGSTVRPAICLSELCGRRFSIVEETETEPSILPKIGRIQKPAATIGR